MRPIRPILSVTVFLFSFILVGVVIFDARFERHIPCVKADTKNILESDDVEARMAWDNLRLRDPASGEIPRGIHSRELAFAKTIAAAPAMKTLSTNIQTSGWRSAGPINVGGRTRAIGIDISNEANVLIATAQGGVFRSTDSGFTWRRTTAAGELKDMTSLVQDHRKGKTNIWYTGTGELLSTTWRRSSVVVAPNDRTGDIGDGIYKSTDDGVTWNLLPSTHDATTILLDSAFDGVWDIVVDNSNTTQDIVYAACLGAIMRSTNGGTTWSRVLGDPVNTSISTDVAITSNGVLYAQLSQQVLGSGKSSTAGVWRSTDGVHWTNITSKNWPVQTQRMRIAIAPSDENTVYIGGLSPSAGYTPVLFKYTYLNGDGSGSGGAWEDRSVNVPQTDGPVSGVGINTYIGYTLVLRVFPTDPELVFFGGTNLFRSSDGFASSNAIDWIGGYGPDPNTSFLYQNHHPDNHDLVFSATNPDRAYSANDGGMFITEGIRGFDDQTYPVTWQNINNYDNAGIIYVVGIDHATPNDSSIIGGFQDQGCWLGQEGQPWQMTTGGDGCYCAIADHGDAIYTSSQEGNVYQYVPNATTWNTITPSGGTPNAQFVTPWMLDPTDNTTMFIAAGGMLQRYSSLIPNGGFVEDLPACTAANGAFITALGMSAIPSHRLYYGTSDGHVFRVDRSDGSSLSPSEITGALFPKNAFVSCVAVDPQNADSIIVCFSNYGVVSLFASPDGGAHWSNVSGNLEQNPDGSGDGPSTRWVSIVHQAGQTLYLVGTSVGLYSTTSLTGPAGTRWVPEGLSTIGRIIVENIDARQSDGFVAIATQGSGVFVTNVVATALSVSPNANAGQNTFSLSPNPASDRSVVSVGLPIGEHLRITAIDLTGRLVASIFDGNAPSGLSNYSFDCSRLPIGSYYVEVQSGEAVETKRLLVKH